jgi:hypothetical protein
MPPRIDQRANHLQPMSLAMRLGAELSLDRTYRLLFAVVTSIL